jgi:alanine racemase
MNSKMSHSLTWVEISGSNLTHNIKTFRQLAGAGRVLCPAIKANAYGHGLKECAPVMVGAGADWLGVNALFEALELRTAGIKVPVYIMGYIALDELQTAVENGFHFVVYNAETLHRLAQITSKLKLPALTHLKVETGIHRQGVFREDLAEILKIYRDNPLVKMEGISTHFANIEDTTDHSYAQRQLQDFQQNVDEIRAGGFNPKYIHAANTAATILFPKTYFTMVRTGIGNYGLWPSVETFISAQHEGKNVALKPVMTWKTSVAQVKKVPADSFVGYGCTYKTRHDSLIAILPVGYYEGYDRGLSNHAYVLLHGKRAPVRGRVCMNMIMVEVTDIPNVRIEDEAVLLGRQGGEAISAEQMAQWLGTINYEVTTRIAGHLERRLVD